MLAWCIGRPHLGKPLDSLIKERLTTLDIAAFATTAANAILTQIDPSNIFSFELHVLSPVYK